MSDFKTIRSENATEGVKKQALRMTIGLAIAFGLSLFSLLLFAAILYFANVSEKWITPVATAAALVSLFLGARYAAKNMQEKGFAFGAVLGGLYYVILYICALACFPDFNFSVRTMIFMLIGALTGGIGGHSVQGTTEKKGKRKKKKR